MVRIAPSLLSADFSNLSQVVRRLEKGGVDLLHLDVMDGHFVPNITFGPLIVKAVDSVTNLPLDVHLMIESPQRHIESFVEAGADYLSLHIEAKEVSPQLLAQVRKMGARPGVALNPETPLSSLDDVLPELDYILIMTVNPGYGGQSLMREVLPKIGELRRRLDEAGLQIEIEVDGGVNLETAPLVVREGAELLVCGSAILLASDPLKVIRDLKRLKRWKREAK